MAKIVEVACREGRANPLLQGEDVLVAIVQHLIKNVQLITLPAMLGMVLVGPHLSQRQLWPRGKRRLDPGRDLGLPLAGTVA